MLLSPDGKQTQESTGAELFDSVQVKDLAKQDLNLFSALVAHESMSLAFPGFYEWLWQQLTDILMRPGRNFDRYALGLPRGHAKSTIVKLLIVYAVVYSNRRYVLVIGANTKKAEAIIADVCDMLDSMNINQVFGNWRYDLEVDRQELKKFTFNGRPVILEAAGYGTAIRGTNQKNERPDFIVFDDAQTKECAESITEAKAFQQWFLGTAMKAKSPMRCLFLYVGNMYKDVQLQPGIYACMLRNLQLSESWTSFIVGAILADGTALWEELQPLQQLYEELQLDRQMGQEDIFFAEVQNCPNPGTSNRLDVSAIGVKLPVEGEQHEGNYIVIDPATSKRTPDKAVILYNELYDTVPAAIEMIVGDLTAPEIVEQTIKLALRRGCSLIVVESNAYQYSLCEWFAYYIERAGIHGLVILDLYTRGTTKNSRIAGFFKSLITHKYLLAPELKSQFVSQASAFDMTRTDNLDDILDAGEMSVQVAVKFRHMIALPNMLLHGDVLSERECPSQDRHPTPCSF